MRVLDDELAGGRMRVLDDKLAVVWTGENATEKTLRVLRRTEIHPFIELPLFPTNFDFSLCYRAFLN